ncbi:MAG: type 4a pilus biogenesis protein PilO [Patescibacteria group bacterium]|nr:type 4a pilus biogenesis protein PilO [Patescibacteria group bacterium]
MKFKEIKLIYTAVLLGAIIAVYIFLVMPLRSSISQTRQNLQNQKITQEILKNRSENISTYKKDIEEIKTKKNRLEDMFISSEKQIDFFRQLENVAKDLNLNLNYTLEQTSNNKDNIKTVNLKIKLDGAYTDNLKYLASLEALPYYIKTSNISFTNSNNSNITVNIQAITYWQNNEN